MDLQLLKSLLKYEFYTENRHKLSKRLFADEISELFEVISDAHDKYQHDLTSSEIFHLWKDRYPTSTTAEIESVNKLIQSVENQDDLASDIAVDLIESLWKRESGRVIAELGIAISEGKEAAYEKLLRHLDNIRNGFMPDESDNIIEPDIDDLLNFTSDNNRLQFNIRSLSNHVYGIGPTDFAVVFARPETGKTAFGVSLACSPLGFCDQGARVLYGVNEEHPKKTMLRAIQAHSGMTKEEIIKSPQKAMKDFEFIKDQLTMIDLHSWSMSRLNSYLLKEKYDVIILDQLDKLETSSNSIPKHEKIRELYIDARQMGSRFETGVIAISQASVEAEGKTVLTPDMMEFSKTGKYAEADLIIGIGKFPDIEVDDDPIRFLTIGKNKLSGWHGQVTCKLEAKISRYVD